MSCPYRRTPYLGFTVLGSVMSGRRFTRSLGLAAGYSVVELDEMPMQSVAVWSEH